MNTMLGWNTNYCLAKTITAPIELFHRWFSEYNINVLYLKKNAHAQKPNVAKPYHYIQKPRCLRADSSTEPASALHSRLGREARVVRYQNDNI